MTPIDSDTGPQSSLSLTHSTLDGKPAVLRPARNISAIVAAAGALVVGGAFFLPWGYVAQSQIDVNGNPSTSSGQYVSGWHQATQFFTTQGVNTTDAITFFFLTAMPFIMAAIVLIVAGGDLARRLAPLAWIFALTAGIFGVLALFMDNLFYFILIFELGLTSTNATSLHVGYGIVLAFVGYLALMAGCIGALMQRQSRVAGA